MNEQQRADAIIDKYAPSIPPEDVYEIRCAVQREGSANAADVASRMSGETVFVDQAEALLSLASELRK